MPRLRSVLQQRADRFRSKQAAQRKPLVPLALTDDASAHYNDPVIVKPHLELEGGNADFKYTLEATDTHATAVETFSSGEENTAYSDENEQSQLEGEEFLDLAYEASRQERNEFTDLVEAPNHVEDVRDERETEEYAQPETIEFVDSEDGQVFNISREATKNTARSHVPILQNVRSLDDSNTLESDECSKTLNTNTETLKRMPSHNEDDLEEVKLSDRFNNLHVDIRDDEEGFEGIELEDPAVYENDVYENDVYENDDYDEAPAAPTQGSAQLFDCDDGDLYYAQEGVNLVGYEEDGTFFEQLRNEHSHHESNYHTHPSSMGVVEEEVQAGQWKSVSNQVHYENQHHANNNHQLEDPYLSDGNSSWEEGSFATGASRTLSRIDTADEEEDGNTYQTFDGSGYYSDENSQAERTINDAPVVRILKKIRSNVEGDHVESSDEEDDHDDVDGVVKKKVSKTRKHRRRAKKNNSHWFVESVRELGTEVLDDAIEFAESDDKANTVIDSFASLFSCGGNF